MEDENPNEFNTSVVDIGKLAEPATRLIEKVSEGVGGIFRPFQLKRVAKAEAEASITKAWADSEAEGIQRRALQRFVEEEIIHQQNMESIIERSIPLLDAGAKPEEVENDFVANFFDKARLISNEQMQELYARVLAGEANMPGTFSKRTISILGDLSSEYAEQFRRLCKYKWMFHAPTLVIFDRKNDIYIADDVSYSSLSELQSLGLVHAQLGNFVSSFARIADANPCEVSYFGQKYRLTSPDSESFEIEIGLASFTDSGEELSTICAAEPVDGFVEYVLEKWKEYKPTRIP